MCTDGDDSYYHNARDNNLKVWSRKLRNFMASVQNTHYNAQMDKQLVGNFRNVPANVSINCESSLAFYANKNHDYTAEGWYV